MPDSSWGRRRLRTLSIFLFLLAIFSVAQGIYFSYEDSKQRDCYKNKIDDLVTVLQDRGELASQDSELTTRAADQDRQLWLIYADAAGLLKDDPLAELPKEEQERLQRDLVSQLLSYKEETQKIAADKAKIQEERKKNPIPDFPEGSCEQ